jgi:beta-aspartyl-peptidase (threonine type)
MAAIARGGSAVDAVVAAVVVLEDAPALNAGRGSYPNRDGIVEMDALVMEGRDLRAGAVAAVQGVRHPVELARLVMERTPHVLLVGEGAVRIADEAGIERCSNEDLLIAGGPALSSDTVGAVAVDARGNVACATSTGGIRDKLPGRVGDSPLVGCGGYADNAGAAVSATGDGEAFIRLVISKRVSDAVAGGMAPQLACEEALALLHTRLAATGGLIALDVLGRPGVAWNTPAMPYAVARAPA